MSIGGKQWLQGVLGRAGLSAAALLAALSAASMAQTVPPAVITSLSAIGPSGIQFPTKVVQDGCGNFYEMEAGGTLMEVPAGSSTAVSLALPPNGLTGGSYGLAVYGSSDLYVAGMDGSYAGAGGHIWKIPITNCAPQLSSAVDLASDIDSLGPISYFWAPADIAVDASNNVFATTGVSCCTPTAYWVLEISSSGTPTALASNLASEATSVAVDASDDVFYTSGTTVYELPYSDGAYASSPTAVITTLTNAFGLSFDAAGDLYIGDTGAGSIYEVPYAAASGTSTPSLQFGSAYLVATGLAIGSPLTAGINGTNDPAIFYSPNAPGGYTSYGSFSQQTLGSVNLGSQALSGASSASGTLDVVFNADVTPAAIAAVSGGVTSRQFALGSGSCAAGTAYTAKQSCTVVVNYAPSAPGVQGAAVILSDSSGANLASAQVFGTGLGAALTVDPGSATALGSGFTSPEGVAVDASGNVFVADAGANTVDEYAAGSSTSVPIGSGLSKPMGVAIDSQGDVFVADSGNNRIVEVPLLSGALSNSAQMVVASGSIAGSDLNAPAGVATDAAGNLYIADSGNSRIVFVPNDGSLEVGAAYTVGSGFSSPLAVTADASGDLYVADSGNGKVDKIVWPLGAGQVEVVAANLEQPSALALDASGSLYVVNEGSSSVLRIPNEGGTLVQNDAIGVGAGIAAPSGMAIDGAGDLYISDSTNAAVWSVSRISGALSFGFVLPGNSSSEEDATVASSGNQALTLNSPFYTASGATGDYTIGTSSSSACANSGSIATGTSCVVGATFAPLTTDSGLLTDSLTFSSNAANASSEQLVLSGTAAVVEATTTTLAITSPASGNPFAGQPISLSASVTSSTGTPSGTVSFSVDGEVAGTAALSNGTATFQLPNGLNGGSHGIEASYAGAEVGTTIYGASTSPLLTLNVAKASTSTALTVVTTYNNPANDLTTNAISFTAVVTPGSTSLPTGAVQFMNGAAVLGSAPVQPASGGTFAATFSSTLPAGAYNVTAVYAGDVNYDSSTSAASTFTIVSAPNFTITQSAGSLTSSNSSPGSITVTLTSWGGWTGLVGLHCSGLPSYAQCLFLPGQPTVYASTPSNTIAPAQFTMEITTDNYPGTANASRMVWWASGITGLALFWSRRRAMKGTAGKVLTVLALVFLASALSTLISCGSAGPQYVTPPGTTTVTVTATGSQFAPGTANLSTQSCSSSANACQSSTFQVAFTAN